MGNQISFSQHTDNYKRIRQLKVEKKKIKSKLPKKKTNAILTPNDVALYTKIQKEIYKIDHMIERLENEIRNESLSEHKILPYRSNSSDNQQLRSISDGIYIRQKQRTKVLRRRSIRHLSKSKKKIRSQRRKRKTRLRT